MAGRRRIRNNVIVPLASMGDIAFLLIAFFILVSTFDRNDNITYEPPDSADIEEFDQVPEIQIVVDEDLAIWFNGQQIGGVDEVEGLVSAAVADREGEARRVVLRCDENTPQDIYQPILEAIAEASVPIAMAGDPIDGPGTQGPPDPGPPGGAQDAGNP